MGTRRNGGLLEGSIEVMEIRTNESTRVSKSDRTGPPPSQVCHPIRVRCPLVPPRRTARQLFGQRRLAFLASANEQTIFVDIPAFVLVADDFGDCAAGFVHVAHMNAAVRNRASSRAWGTCTDREPKCRRASSSAVEGDSGSDPDNTDGRCDQNRRGHEHAAERRFAQDRSWASHGASLRPTVLGNHNRAFCGQNVAILRGNSWSPTTEMPPPVPPPRQALPK